jgi:16S rRNA (cytidine1402-2'-O)-methyltransferase
MWALVTDAGTPGVSDPGVELVAACRQFGHSPWNPDPGTERGAAGGGRVWFSIEFRYASGFPPLKSKARNEWFATVAASRSTLVFFESPHRIASTLSDLRLYLGERHICVAREMTKAHQEFLVGPATDDRFSWR